MAKKVGTLIKEARTDAGMSQEQLARKIKGLSAAELGKAERGETELTQALLKEIAKATGVTQSSLLNAAKASAPAKKTETAKKTAAAKKTETAKKAASSKKTSTAKKAETELTAAEKKLVELYRAADAETRKKAVAVLKGEAVDNGDLFSALLGMAGDILGKK